MIRFLGKLPRRPAIAVSGGADSMAILDFLKRKDPLVLHFNHGTEHGDVAERFVREYCKEHDLKLIVGKSNRVRSKDESPEEFWRNIRYEFLGQDFGLPIITCHNLDDQVEQWIFSSFHGNPKLIPYRRANIIRPFMLTTKSCLEGWCVRNDVPFVVDPSNHNDRYARSFIRHEIVPKALKVNPGIYKVVKKKVQKEFEFYSNV